MSLNEFSQKIYNKQLRRKNEILFHFWSKSFVTLINQLSNFYFTDAHTFWCCFIDNKIIVCRATNYMNQRLTVNYIWTYYFTGLSLLMIIYEYDYYVKFIFPRNIIICKIGEINIPFSPRTTNRYTPISLSKILYIFSSTCDGFLFFL